MNRYHTSTGASDGDFVLVRTESSPTPLNPPSRTNWFGYIPVSSRGNIIEFATTPLPLLSFHHSSELKNIRRVGIATLVGSPPTTILKAK